MIVLIYIIFIALLILGASALTLFIEKNEHAGKMAEYILSKIALNDFADDDEED